jgi:hypothetical protein
MRSAGAKLASGLQSTWCCLAASKQSAPKLPGVHHLSYDEHHAYRKKGMGFEVDKNARVLCGAARIVASDYLAMVGHNLVDTGQMAGR